MEFDKSKVYTSVNADDVKVGSKGYFADNVSTLKGAVLTEDSVMFGEVEEIFDEFASRRFDIKDESGAGWGLFYLVEEPEEKRIRACRSREELFTVLEKYKQPFYVYDNNTDDMLLITRVDRDRLSLNGEPISFLELKDNFHFQDGTPCGIEE